MARKIGKPPTGNPPRVLRIASTAVFAVSIALSGIAGADSRASVTHTGQETSVVSEAVPKLPVGASWHFDTEAHSQEVTLTLRSPTGHVKRISVVNHKESGHSILIEDVLEPTLDILCKNVSRRICRGHI